MRTLMLGYKDKKFGKCLIPYCSFSLLDILQKMKEFFENDYFSYVLKIQINQEKYISFDTLNNQVTCLDMILAKQMIIS